MQISTWTYAIGALQVAFGILALVFQWTDSTVAMGLITTGLAVFGITHQNVKLGAVLGHKV